MQFIQPSFTHIYFPIIIESVVKRLEENPSSNCLNTQLLNIIYSCICSDMENTLFLLEKQLYLQKFFDKISLKIDHLNTNYDRKVMIIGLSNLLMSVQLFTNNKGIYINLLIFTLKILQSLQLLETKKLSKKDLKQLDFEKDSSKYDKSHSKKGKLNKDQLNSSIKKLRKMKKKALKDLSIDENYPEKLDILYDTIKNISSKIKKIDEFLFFSSCLKYAEQSGIKLTSCLDSLGEKMTSFLYQIIKCHRIDVENPELKIKSVRRIVTAKRMIAKSEIIPPNYITPKQKKSVKGEHNLKINNK